MVMGGNLTFYKIRRKSDGYFSSGGQTPHWAKDGGKVWGSLRNLELHLLQFKFKSPYDNCEVVEYQTTERIIPL